MSKRTLLDEISTKKAKPALPAWAEKLDIHGFCVVPDVLIAEECDAALAGIHRYLADAGVDLVTPGKAKDYPNVHGIIQHLEIGHCQAVWDVRLNERVQEVFAQIYGTNDLLVSFDGACIMQPWHRFGKKSWAHMDQSAANTTRQCIQGYVNLTDSRDDRTGSLFVMPNTHKLFGAFFEQFPEMRAKSKGDWCKLESDEQREFLEALDEDGDSNELVRVYGGRGSMVLWDSRSVHQNIPPACGADEARQRCVVYTCYQPRAWCTEKNLAKKAKAFDEYRLTSHWSSSKIKLFPKQPRTYGAEPKQYAIVRDRVPSQRMLELAGKVPMTSRAKWQGEPLLRFG